MIVRTVRYVEYRCKKCGHTHLHKTRTDPHTLELLEAVCNWCHHKGEPDATTLMTGPDGEPLL